VQALSIRYESGKPVIIADFQTLATALRQQAAKAGDHKASLMPCDAFFKADHGQPWRKPHSFLPPQTSSVFIFISLIQISSSSKGRTFLWIASFFSFKSRTWRLFNPVPTAHELSRRR
jgi:hypothetical protein